MEFLTLTISAIFISNILLMQYLGNCPFLGVSKKMDTAVGMSGAVIFVLTLSGDDHLGGPIQGAGSLSGWSISRPSCSSW